MLPWGHGSVGYLLYSMYVRRFNGAVPAEIPAFAVLVGTQFPDLVDKPLAWTFNLIPSGRLIGHSLLILCVVCYLGYRVCARYEIPAAGIGFSIGAFSHALVDALPSILAGNFHEVTFLVWPILPPSSYDEHGRSIIAYLLSIEPSVSVGIELLITGIALGVWWRDGTPGTVTLKGMADRVRTFTR